ncbi:hypothetical protein ACROYT_G028859 [Oculina patagonica]
MAQGQVPSPSDGKLDFDDDTLRAIANVYLLEGNKEYNNKDVFNAIYFYTEGLQVNCKDDELNAKLYSNRATAYFHSGSYQQALNDATAAVQLEPTFIKAIERGASACLQLQCYDEAIIWCEKGLAVSFYNIQSSFTVQNPRAQLVKTDHVILLYLCDSAVLTIMHKNRALLKMSSASRLAELEEKYIPQIINDPIPNKIEEDNN